MAHGHPDYHRLDYHLADVNIDVSSLIQILKGTQSVDARGRALIFETFAEGLDSWLKNNDVGASNPVVATDRPEISPVGVRFTVDHTQDGSVSILHRYFPHTGSTVVGVELGLEFASASPDWDIFVYYWSDSGGHVAELYIDFIGKTVKIKDDSGYQQILTLGSSPGSGCWMVVKLVCDFGNAQYVRLIMGTQEYDLSGYAIPSGSNNVPGVVNFEIDALRHLNCNDTGYLGHVIVTLDEPL